MSKTLLVIRHAHRNKNLTSSDNGLSEKGEKQAKNLSKYFENSFTPKNFRFLSSPKKRCLETIEPLAKTGKREIKIIPMLDEGGNIEAKTKAFLDWYRKSKRPFLAICSHGDWIPLFLEKATGIPVALNKGAMAELILEDEKFQLRQVIQDFDF